MKKLKKKNPLHFSEFPNTQVVGVDGLEREIPELTEENFWTLVDDYNKLIKCFNDAVYSLNKEIKQLKSR